MDEKVLSYSSPLYKGRTASLKLTSMKFLEIKDFFPGNYEGTCGTCREYDTVYNTIGHKRIHGEVAIE